MDNKLFNQLLESVQDINRIEPDAALVTLHHMGNNEIDRKIAQSLGITNYTGDRILWTQDPVYAWGLMTSKRIGLNPITGGLWRATAHGGVWRAVDENPCRAICIAYLKELANIGAAL